MSLEIIPVPSPESVVLRKMTTRQYGNITLVVAALITVLTVVVNYLSCSSFKSPQPIKYIRRRWRLYHTVSLWTIVIFFLSWHTNNNDFLWVTKRTGRVATALMPTLLFLTLKPTPLPYTLYLQFLPLHKWLSRIVVLQSLIHAIMYTWVYTRLGKLAKLLKFSNVVGIVAMFAFLMIALTSLRPIRRKTYQFFYFIHYTLTWFSVILLFYHAKPGIGYYTIANISILIGQIVYRIYKTTTFKIINNDLHHISPSLYIVTIPRRCLPSYFQPASHLRILARTSQFNLLSWVLPSRPYTIASLPTDDNIKLIIRKTRSVMLPDHQYSLYGAFKCFEGNTFFGARETNSITNHNYGEISIRNNHNDINYSLDGVDKVLFVCGGSAVSMALPLMRILNHNGGIPFRLIWAVRDPRDVEILEYFDIRGGDIEIYITEKDLKKRLYNLHSNASSVVESETDPLMESNICNPYGSNSFSSYNSNMEYSSPSEGARKPVMNVNISQHDVQPIVDNGVDRVLSEESIGIHIDRVGHYERGNPDLVNEDESLTFGTNIIKESNSQKLKNNKRESRHEHSTRSSEYIQDSSEISFFKGRPVLGCRLYDWLLDNGCCEGPQTSNDEHNVCCRDLEQANIYKEGDKKRLWVIAAGPNGLVQQVKKWSLENGLTFHEEKFSL